MATNYYAGQAIGGFTQETSSDGLSMLYVTQTIPVSGQKLTIEVRMASSCGDTAVDMGTMVPYATANGGAGCEFYGTIAGVSSDIVISCNSGSYGYSQSNSGGYSNGYGGRGAFLNIGGNRIIQCGGGGGGKVTFTGGKPEAVTNTLQGYNSLDTSHSRNSDGMGATLVAGQSYVSANGVTFGDYSMNDSWGSNCYVNVSVVSVLNYAPYITSFTSPATIATGNNIMVNWTGVQDIVNGTLTFDLDYTTDGGTTWTSLLSSSTATTYSLATPVVSGSKTYQFRVRAKNSGYTGTYSYSTTVLTGNLKPDDANSVALLHFDATQDETGKIMIPYGGAQVSSSAAKFGSTGLQLNGTSQYITTSSIIPNSGDFTCEFFAYATSSTQYPTLFSTRSSANNGILLGTTGTDNRISFSVGNGSWLFQTTSTLTFTRNSWHHFAVCRSGSNFYVFCDGILYCSGNSSSNITNQTFCLGFDLGNPIAGGYLNGYIDELRVSNVARYTSSFTPPTSAFTSDANTVFLSHFDKSLFTGLEDMCGNTWTSVNASLSSQILKFGSSSLLLPSGSVITAPYSSSFAFPADFTIECFIYPTSYASSYGSNIFTRCWSGTNFVQFWMDTSGKIRTTLSSTQLSNTVGTVATLNNWHHVALVRSSSTVYLFLDGIVQGTMSLSTDLTNSNTQAVCIGGYSHNTSQMPFIGAIDEFRISKVARYTANFTPPSMPFGSSLQGFYRYII